MNYSDQIGYGHHTVPAGSFIGKQAVFPIYGHGPQATAYTVGKVDRDGLVRGNHATRQRNHRAAAIDMAERTSAPASERGAGMYVVVNAEGPHAGRVRVVAVVSERKAKPVEYETKLVAKRAVDNTNLI